MKNRILLAVAAALLLFVSVLSANDYYSPSGAPATGAAGSSASMRSEFATIEDGFDKLPTFSGNALEIVRINAGETAMETYTGTDLGATHNIADHADTTATGTELETLTDTSDASALHNHTATNLNDTTATGAELTTLTNASDASSLHTHASTYLPLAGGTMSGNIYTGVNKIQYGSSSGAYLSLSTTGWAIFSEATASNWLSFDASGLYNNYADASTGKGLNIKSASVTKGQVLADSTGNLYLVALGGVLYTKDHFYPHTDGNLYLGNSGNQWHTMYAVNASVISSNANLKKNIKPLDSNDVAWLYDLEAIEYKWKDEGKGKENHYGFTAQDVYDKNPKKDSWLVKKSLKAGGDENNPDDFYWGMSPSELVGPMVKLIQDQKALIDTLTTRLEALEARVATLETL